MTRYLTRRNDGHNHSIYLPDFTTSEPEPEEGAPSVPSEHPDLAAHQDLGLAAVGQEGPQGPTKAPRATKARSETKDQLVMPARVARPSRSARSSSAW